MGKTAKKKEYKVTWSVEKCSPEERAARDREITTVLTQAKLKAMKARGEI